MDRSNRYGDHGNSESDLPQGTLDLLIPKTVALGPVHSYAIAQRLQQISRDVIQVSGGSLYPALSRLDTRKLLAADWRRTETGREATFYRLTRSGRTHLEGRTSADHGRTQHSRIHRQRWRQEVDHRDPGPAHQWPEPFLEAGGDCVSGQSGYATRSPRPTQIGLVNTTPGPASDPQLIGIVRRNSRKTWPAVSHRLFQVVAGDDYRIARHSHRSVSTGLRRVARRLGT
ncbi:MAG: helix-turn-helix transcriptional regulator [Acidobacteria bacterium]|nr:helix-turn-helix transcriptional regulator [Acidobacteriota bacterium]